ncbi:hypothetical protein PMIN01_12927 [Paraphaeosphaeria minitans]|uniref:Uncharacterized protein n=1 Tax=Paraphaeosphaeria minitans TaxID=565426 RepID=A0A9P6G5J6_9PLEO|nr:hypothetical protein PMIN01_12927 [Paraphaeosphaeria minitans]
MTHTSKGSSHPTQTAGFSNLHGTHRNTAATNPIVTVATSSTTLANTHSPSALNSLHGDINLPSATSTPAEASPDLTEHTSTKISLAFLGVILLILACLWIFFFGLPKYRKYLAKGRARRKTQASQRQWWDWIKVDREIPVRSQSFEVRQVRHLSETSTVLEEVAAMSPLRASGATTVGSWPMRSAPHQLGPVDLSTAMSFPPLSLSSPHPQSTPSGARHNRMRSYETYKNDLHQVYRHSDESDQFRNPYNSPTIFMGVEDAKVVRMQSASPDQVVVAKKEVRRFSFEYSIGDKADDGFEKAELRNNS